MGWRNVLYRRIYVDFSFFVVQKVCTKAILLGERSVRIREVKGSNPSRSTFSSSVILTLLLFFCVHISHTLAFRPERIRTALPCCKAGQAISPVGCCLVRGFQPVGMSTGDALASFCTIRRFLCLKNFGRPCRAPNPEVGCEPGWVINIFFENPSVSRFFLCILQSAAGKRIAFMPPSRKFLQKSPHHRRLTQP